MDACVITFFYHNFSCVLSFWRKLEQQWSFSLYIYCLNCVLNVCLLIQGEIWSMQNSSWKHKSTSNISIKIWSFMVDPWQGRYGKWSWNGIYYLLFTLLCPPEQRISCPWFFPWQLAFSCPLKVFKEVQEEHHTSIYKELLYLFRLSLEQWM